MDSVAIDLATREGGVVGFHGRPVIGQGNDLLIEPRAPIDVHHILLYEVFSLFTSSLALHLIGAC